MGRKKEWKNDWTDGHYVVAIGYDRGKIYFEDPYAYERTFLSFRELNDRWHDVAGGNIYNHFGIALYGKAPKFKSRRMIHMG